MTDNRLLREYRIRSRGEFRRVYERRCSVADDLLVVRGCENEMAFPRLGLAVPRQVGSAVVRNVWKRLIREAFRLSRAELPAGIDLVVSPRKGATPSLEAFLDSLPRLARRVARRLNKTAG